jgi:hypothetical protein
MALTPIISACLNECTGITIKDTTGFYNVTTNLGGWNDNSTVYRVGPNTPNIQSATITITLNSASTPFLTVDVTTEVQEAIFPLFDLYTYAPTDAYSNSTLVDGSYTITYTIIDSSNVTYTTDTTVVVYCNVACCVANKAVTVASELCNDCDSQAYEDFLLADGILQSLKAVAECSGETEFLKLLNKLQRLCGTSTTGGCGCGCS